MAIQDELQFSKDLVTWREDRWLSMLSSIKNQADLKYLEIGSFEGRSVIWMMKNIFTHSTSSAEIIDSFYDKNEAILRRNLKVANLTEKVHIHEGSSHLKLRNLPLQQFNLIYVDGCHCCRHLFSDLALAWDLLKPKSFMILDDYGYKDHSPDEPSPKSVIDFFIECFKKELTVVYKGYEVIIEKTGKLHG